MANRPFLVIAVGTRRNAARASNQGDSSSRGRIKAVGSEDVEGNAWFNFISMTVMPMAVFPPSATDDVAAG